MLVREALRAICRSTQERSVPAVILKGFSLYFLVWGGTISGTLASVHMYRVPLNPRHRSISPAEQSERSLHFNSPNFGRDSVAVNAQLTASTGPTITPRPPRCYTGIKDIKDIITITITITVAGSRNVPVNIGGVPSPSNRSGIFPLVRRLNYWICKSKCSEMGKMIRAFLIRVRTLKPKICFINLHSLRSSCVSACELRSGFPLWDMIRTDQSTRRHGVVIDSIV